ncbi:hypothetical protein [Sphingomonas sp. VL_57B]|uniref:hypothetical protein n=1 Tax=Sphingomonas sp. VL_57B TaxID=3144220 RepID=UPI0031F4AD07
MRCEEAHHLALQTEAARGEAFKPLADDGSDRFVRHHHLAVPCDALELVADRRAHRPVTGHGPCPHAVLGLVGVLLTLMLRYGGEKVLDKLRVGILAELDRWRLQNAADAGDGRAQLDVRFEAARETRDVIDDDDGVAALPAQESQHRLHAGTVGERAGSVVAEDFHDLIILVGRKLPAADFLRFKAMSLRLLLGAGDARVDDGD